MHEVEFSSSFPGENINEVRFRVRNEFIGAVIGSKGKVWFSLFYISLIIFYFIMYMYVLGRLLMSLLGPGVQKGPAKLNFRLNSYLRDSLTHLC